MSVVKDIDRGIGRYKQELARAKKLEVAVGILSGSKSSEGASIAEYATHNEYGTKNIPSRPFMRTAYDENQAAINADFDRQARALIHGRKANVALTMIGQAHAERIKNTITERNFLPALAEGTVRTKKGSTKTLVDTGAMVNAVQIEIRQRTS